MLPTKGVVRIPTGLYERIACVVASFAHEEFTHSEIQRQLPNIHPGSIRAFLAKKARSRWLERTGRGRYRQGGVRNRTTLPMGLIAEAVWLVFSTDPERRFMRLAQVVGEAESVVTRPGVSLYCQVSNVINYWHRSSHLERRGKRGEYEHRLKESVTERPVLRWE